VLEKNSKGKNTGRDLPTLSPIINCYKYQSYEHVAVNYASSFKIVINDKISTEAPKPDSNISLKITHVIKEFTVTRPISSSALLLTPPSPPPLLLIPTIITCFGH